MQKTSEQLLLYTEAYSELSQISEMEGFVEYEKNYRPISLLPVLGKIFVRLIYKDLFNHFYCNNLFTQNQSGFMPGDSRILQSLSIVHEINSSLDFNPTIDVRGVFLDISNAFDKVWHEGLLFKLESHGMGGELLNLLKDRVPTESSF